MHNWKKKRLLEVEAGIKKQISILEKQKGNISENLKMQDNEIDSLQGTLQESERQGLIPKGATLEQALKIQYAKEIQASIIAHGRPTPTQVRWLMSCPKGEEFLRAIPNLVPEDMKLLTGLVSKESNLYELLSPYKQTEAITQ